MKAFTKEDYHKYEELIRAKKKAMECSEETRAKFQKRYDEIVQSLQEGFKPYIGYYITGGNNNMTKDEAELIGRFTGMFKGISACISKGDIEGVHTGLYELRFILMKYRGQEYEAAKL